jgi:putative SOS response-associated peptidase YedK
MCGRFTLRRPEKLKLDRFNRLRLPLPDPRFNIAPSQNILVFVKRKSGAEYSSFRWGLIPSWSKEPKGFINARCETLDEKASFTESFQKRRCLIPADGFYEWKRSGRSKQPYYFQMQDESAFMFAGIWDEWLDNKVPIASCAIVTTTANELLASVHDRMPVILNRESCRVWLDPNTPAEELKKLLTPFPASLMKSHSVSSDVNSPENEDEHLPDYVEAEVGVTPSLFH